MKLFLNTLLCVLFSVLNIFAQDTFKDEYLENLMQKRKSEIIQKAIDLNDREWEIILLHEKEWRIRMAYLSVDKEYLAQNNAADNFDNVEPVVVAKSSELIESMRRVKEQYSLHTSLHDISSIFNRLQEPENREKILAGREKLAQERFLKQKMRENYEKRLAIQQKADEDAKRALARARLNSMLCWFIPGMLLFIIGVGILYRRTTLGMLFVMIGGAIAMIPFMNM